jgi:hypothetical protein
MERDAIGDGIERRRVEVQGQWRQAGRTMPTPMMMAPYPYRQVALRSSFHRRCRASFCQTATRHTRRGGHDDGDDNCVPDRKRSTMMVLLKVMTNDEVSFASCFLIPDQPQLFSPYGSTCCVNMASTLGPRMRMSQQMRAGRQPVLPENRSDRLALQSDRT